MKVPKARHSAVALVNKRQPFESREFFVLVRVAQRTPETGLWAGLLAGMHQKGAFCAWLQVLTRVGARRPLMATIGPAPVQRSTADNCTIDSPALSHQAATCP